MGANEATVQAAKPLSRLRRVMAADGIRRPVMLGAGRGISSILAAAWLIAVARRLSLGEFGQLSVAMALTLILATFTDFGLQTVLAKDVLQARRLRRGVVYQVVWRRLAVALVGGAVLIGAYRWVTGGASVVVPLLFSVSLVGSAAYNLLIGGYRTLGHVRLEIAAEVATQAALLVGGITWLALGGRLIAVATLYCAATLIRGAWIGVRVWRDSDPVMGSEPSPRFNLRSMAPFVLATSVVPLYQRVDSYLVAMLRGVSVAGVYAASYRFNDANLILPTALGQLALSQGLHAERSQRLQICRRVALQSVVAAAVPGVLVAVLAQPIVAGLFGPRYLPAVPVVIVLLLSTLPGAVAVSLVPMAAISNPNGFAVATGTGLLVNVAFNVALIPTWGAIGAAWANVASQAYVAAVLYLVLRRDAAAAQGSA